MSGPIQLSWFADPYPELLPIWLIAFGLEAMLFGVVYPITQNAPGFQRVSRVERIIATAGVALGYLFLTLSVLRTSYAAYAVYLHLLFRGVEGAAAPHLYVKVYDLLKGNGYGGSLGTKVKHKLAVLFVLALGAYLAVKAVVGMPQIGGYWYNLGMVYTVVVASVTALAVRWRYREISDELNSGVVMGLALCIAGAQVYGFTLAGDIALTVAGSVVYAIGFWASAYYHIDSVVTSSSPPTTGRCPHCQQPLPPDQQPKFCPHCGNSV